VSVLTDIIQLLGTGSVPVVVAGSVLGLFELGERFASQRAKDALSKWLLTFDVQKAKALPDGTQQLFERIFGERHFSLKCLFRSVVFSSGAMIFIAILWFLITARGILFIFSNVFFVTLGTLWLCWSIIIDYFSLLKTRIILQIMTGSQLRTVVGAIATLSMDLLIYLIIYTIGITIVCSVAYDILLQLPMPSGWLLNSVVSSVVGLIRRPLSPLMSSDPIFFTIFWAGFAPSLWMWLYLAALFVTRALIRSEKLITWLRWGLDVEKNPFRSIGAVAAALTFIASVAVILVSAEVSRISAV
jgi:hypothetical protein